MAVPPKHNLYLTNYQIKHLKKKLKIKSLDDIDIVILKDLKERMKILTDTRQKSKVVYKIWDIVITTIVANFADNYDWQDVVDFVKSHYKWFKSFLQMTGGIASAQTYENIFAIIDSKELENIMVNFYKYLIPSKNTEYDLINIDGRVDRGSSRKKTDYSNGTKPLNVLSAYSNKFGICLASEQIDIKSNEIPKIEDILKRFNIKNCIITWDALNTHIKNIAAVVDGHGEYVSPIKGNHPTFYKDLVDYFDEEMQECIIAGKLNTAYLKQIEKSHSAIITYEYFQTTDVKWYADIEKWKKCNSFGMVKKTIKNGEKETIEIRYYISSLYINITDFSNAIRNHWSVENRLHWHLDFTFKEDKNTTRNKRALMNLQLVNKFCLGILDRAKQFYNKSLKRIRKNISNNFEQEITNLLCYLVLAK